MTTNTQRYNLAFLILLTVFVISKITHLNVPYFWDESWVYAPAVNVMADLGPTMYTGSFPLEHSRGHPLLFHFLGGYWITLFGNSLIALHGFALTICIGFIISIFYFIKNIISIEVALASCCLLIFQPLFYAQASIVLPEILLSFLCFLALAFLYKKKWAPYIIVASLAIWTKESALAFVLCLVVSNSLVMLKNKGFKLSELLLVCVPLLSFLLFIWLNKVAFDFYLYPEHTGMLTFELKPILGKLKALFLNVFYDQKRLPFSLIGLMAVGFLLAKKSSLFKEDLLLYLLIPIVGFAIFSSLNFYTVRYVLAIFPLVIITLSWLIAIALQEKKVWLWALTIAITSHSIVQLFDRRSVRDINLSYLDYGPAQLEAIKYFEDEELYNASIHTGFLTSTGLTNKYAGYRSNDKSFSAVNKEMSGDENYFIFSSVEPHYQRDQVLSHPNNKKLKTILKGNVSFEIYQIKGKL